jgi:hypothetical protein
VWHRFWQDVYPLADKERIIDLYEVGLSQRLLAAGVDLEPYVERKAVEAAALARGTEFQYLTQLGKDAFNSTWFMWDLLLTQFEFPYLKTVILRTDPLKSQSLTKWRDIVPDHSRQTLVPLIDDYLRRVRT